ncbi:MAG: NUDIX hydrolase [SAR324 cluster bacterium]|nr:NUDIX hydrolase [SAR324 cluster bacterium]
MDSIEISYQDASGSTRLWECVHRKNRSDAVIIIPYLVPSGKYILIKQFRPPVNAYILEFPAGLIDAGETPEQAAVRELKEETGYLGKVCHTTPRLFTSPGMLSEACYFSFLEVDELLESNQNPLSNPDPEEFIEVFSLATEDIADFIENEKSSGTAIDIKLYTYFYENFFPSIRDLRTK